MSSPHLHTQNGITFRAISYWNAKPKQGELDGKYGKVWTSSFWAYCNDRLVVSDY